MHFLRLTALMLAALLGFAPMAMARMLGDPAVPFSADRTVTVGEQSFTGRLYSVPGHQRHEIAIQGIPQIILLQGDPAKGWLILPMLKSYVEFSFAPAVTELSQPDLLTTKLGEETIAGQRTSKYRIEHSAKDGSMVDGYAWITAEGIPMRLDGNFTPANGGKPTPFRMELTNLRPGQQDPALFTLPPALTKLPAGALAPLLGMRKPG